MDKIYKAKEIYNSAEIPPELEVVVKEAIEQGSARKAKKLSLVKTLAPVAVCAAICLVVGLGGAPFSTVKVESDEGVALSRAIPGESFTVAENAAVLLDTPYGTMVSERVGEEESRGNNLELIYCDENFASFSAITSDGEVKYYNFRENSAAEDVTLSELGVFGFSEDAEFYICGPDTAIVLDGGREIEIMFGGAK